MDTELAEDFLLDFREGGLTGGGLERLSAFFERLGRTEDPGTPLVVHFHGGLVPARAGIEGAARLNRVYREAGAVPLFVIWNWGPLDTLRTNLVRIAGEPLFRYLRRRVAQYADAKERQEEMGSAGDRPRRISQAASGGRDRP